MGHQKSRGPTLAPSAQASSPPAPAEASRDLELPPGSGDGRGPKHKAQKCELCEIATEASPVVWVQGALKVKVCSLQGFELAVLYSDLRAQRLEAGFGTSNPESRGVLFAAQLQLRSE